MTTRSPWEITVCIWFLTDAALPLVLEVARERRLLRCRAVWRWRFRWECVSLGIWVAAGVEWWPGLPWAVPFLVFALAVQAWSFTHSEQLVGWVLTLTWGGRPSGEPLVVMWGSVQPVWAESRRHLGHDVDCKYGPRGRRERRRVRLSWPKLALRPGLAPS